MTTEHRAVSPVVAVALLIGITVLLATTVALVLYGTDLGEAEQPEVTLSFEVNDQDEVLVRHEGGDPLDPANIVVRADNGNQYVLVDDGGNALTADFEAGGTALIGNDTVSPVTTTHVNEIAVVWQNPRSGNDAETILGTFRV